MYIFKFDLFGITIAPTYYGFMYILGFIAGYIIVKKYLNLSSKKLDSLLICIFLGIILGGRIAYVFFYDLTYYFSNPLEIIKTWKGGMSFHGGVIGVIIAMFLYSKKFKISFLKLADTICYSLPFGLFFGRIGNYINKELLGFSPYNGILAVIKDGKSYFPSPLLEAFLEGIVLFLLLSYFKKYKKLKKGQLAALFLVFYAIFRIFVEVFFRVPDSQIGYIFGFLTMGEILSLPMFIIGIYYFIKLGKK